MKTVKGLVMGLSVVAVMLIGFNLSTVNASKKATTDQNYIYFEMVGTPSCLPHPMGDCNPADPRPSGKPK